MIKNENIQEADAKVDIINIDSNSTEEVVNDFVEYGIYELIEIICKKRLSNDELNEYLNNI